MMEADLAKNQYSFAKRQREIAKKKKKEEKAQRKRDKKNPEVGEDAGTPEEETDTTE
jgi:hypothetical protein